MKIKRLLLPAGVCLAAFLSGPLMSQVTTADLVGRVTDATGAVVPDANVTLANLGTNISRTTPSNVAGDYVLNLMPPGRYSLKVEKAGFKTFLVPEITLSAGDRGRVDAPMAIGQTSETIEVTGQATLLQTDSSSIGTSVTGKLVQDCPVPESISNRILHFYIRKKLVVDSWIVDITGYRKITLRSNDIFPWMIDKGSIQIIRGTSIK